MATFIFALNAFKLRGVALTVQVCGLALAISDLTSHPHLWPQPCLFLVGLAHARVEPKYTRLLHWLRALTLLVLAVSAQWVSWSGVGLLVNVADDLYTAFP